MLNVQLDFFETIDVEIFRQIETQNVKLRKYCQKMHAMDSERRKQIDYLEEELLKIKILLHTMK